MNDDSITTKYFIAKWPEREKQGWYIDSTYEARTCKPRLPGSARHMCCVELNGREIKVDALSYRDPDTTCEWCWNKVNDPMEIVQYDGVVYKVHRVCHEEIDWVMK